MYVRTIQLLNYGGQESKKQFAVYDSEKPVTLKQGQGHQTWYELVEPKQGYNNAHLNSVHERANNKVFVRSGNINYLPCKMHSQLTQSPISLCQGCMRI